MACIERFDIVQTNAGKDCFDEILKEDVNFSDLPRCVWDFGGIILYNKQTNTQCMVEGDDTGYVCYNYPTSDNLMFRS